MKVQRFPKLETSFTYIKYFIKGGVIFQNIYDFVLSVFRSSFISKYKYREKHAHTKIFNFQ